MTTVDPLGFDNRERLRSNRGWAIAVMVLFAASIPAFLGVVTYLDNVLELPVNERPCQFLGAFGAVQILFYLWMGILVYRLGRQLGVSWTVPACIASIFIPGIALVALIILVIQAGRALKSTTWPPLGTPT